MSCYWLNTLGFYLQIWKTLVKPLDICHFAVLADSEWRRSCCHEAALVISTDRRGAKHARDKGPLAYNSNKSTSAAKKLTICFTQCSTFLIWSSSQPPFCWEGSLSLFSFMIVLCMLGTCLLESMREREGKRHTKALSRLAVHWRMIHMTCYGKLC